MRADQGPEGQGGKGMSAGLAVVLATVAAAVVAAVATSLQGSLSPEQLRGVVQVRTAAGLQQCQPVAATMKGSEGDPHLSHPPLPSTGSHAHMLVAGPTSPSHTFSHILTLSPHPVVRARAGTSRPACAADGSKTRRPCWRSLCFAELDIQCS